jgi:polysaccharide biosynthesis transport protein
MSPEILLRILLARRWTLIGIPLAAVILAGLLVMITPRSYTAATDLIVDGKGSDPVSGEAVPVRTMAGYLGTQAEIIRSRNVALKVVDELKLAEDVDLARELELASISDSNRRRQRLASYLISGLTVTPKRDSSILSIAFSGRDPALATRIANAFAQAYIQTNLELRIEPAKQITRWYDQQLAGLRTSLIEKQNALSAYQEKHNIVVTTDRLDLESAKLAELSSMLIAAQGELTTNTTRDQAAMQSPQVQRISAELVQAEAKLADLGTKVGENHPQYRQMQSEVESLRRQLGQAMSMISGSLRSAIEQARVREAQLEAELKAQKERVLQLSRNRNELGLLQQEVQTAQAAYDAALARATQTKLESQIALTDIAVLNPATTPSRPTSPRAAMTLVLAALAGILMALTVSLGLEWLDRRVRDPRDLEVDLGLPVLAAIPAVSVYQTNGSKGLARLAGWRAKEVMA